MVLIEHILVKGKILHFMKFFRGEGLFQLCISLKQEIQFDLYYFFMHSSSPVCALFFFNLATEHKT